MDNISKEDIEFLDNFFDDELTEEGLIELDKRLKNPNFKSYYNARLDKKYNVSALRLFVSYLPMFIMIFLFILGIYLITIKM